MGARIVYDLVLSRGRVVDPSTCTDEMLNVGISDGRIACLSSDALDAREVVAVPGLIVAPGFIDFHVHRQDSLSLSLRACDGVTTVFDFEEGAYPVDNWYVAMAGRSPVNYGVTVSHKQVRRLAMRDDQRAVADVATTEELEEIEQLVLRGLQEGAIGIGYGLEYTPGATREEVFELFQLSARLGVLNVVHARHSGFIEPMDCIGAVQEIVANCAMTNASAHLSHIGSTARSRVPRALQLLQLARRHGLDITTEVYPYCSSSTNIRAPIFEDGWRSRLGAEFGDLEWAATGERLTAESFARYRREGGMVIAHIIPEQALVEALLDPNVIIVSDGLPFLEGRGHPRGAGTCARVLARYVRERGVLSIGDAIRKLSFLPAARLERLIPVMKWKGRLIPGADADLTVFDPELIADQATYETPTLPSAGIVHVLVGGTFVVRETIALSEVLPGRPVRGKSVVPAPAGVSGAPSAKP